MWQTIDRIKQSFSVGDARRLTICSVSRVEPCRLYHTLLVERGNKLSDNIYILRLYFDRMTPKGTPFGVILSERGKFRES